MFFQGERNPGRRYFVLKYKKRQGSGSLKKRLLTLLIMLAASICFFPGCSYDPARSHFERAEAFFNEGRYREAAGQYAYVADKFQGTPYGPKSLYRIVNIYARHIVDKKKALEERARLSYLYPGSTEAALAGEDMAAMYSAAGEHGKAIEEYQRLLEESPGESEKYQYLIAMEYVFSDDFHQARIELKELIKTAATPEAVQRALYQIANTYYLGGDIKKAIEAYDETISRFPDSGFAVEAEFGKAKALEEEGRLAEALSMLKGLIGRYPNTEAVSERIEWLEKSLKEGPSQIKRVKRKRVSTRKTPEVRKSQ